MKNLSGKRLGMVFRMRMIFFRSNLRMLLWSSVGMAVVVVAINYFTEGRNWAEQVSDSMSLIIMIPFILSVNFGFAAFLVENEEGKGIVLPVSYLEKYMGLWLACLLHGFLYWVVAFLVATVILLFIGAMQMEYVPVSEYFSTVALQMGPKVLAMMALVSALALGLIQKKDGQLWSLLLSYLFPIGSLILIFLIFGETEIIGLLSGLVLGVTSIVYLILGYYKFRSVCLKLKLK